MQIINWLLKYLTNDICEYGSDGDYKVNGVESAVRAFSIQSIIFTISNDISLERDCTIEAGVDEHIRTTG